MDSMRDELTETIIREHPGAAFGSCSQRSTRLMSRRLTICSAAGIRLRSFRFHCTAHVNRCTIERNALGRIYTWPRQSSRLSQRARV